MPRTSDWAMAVVLSAVVSGGLSVGGQTPVLAAESAVIVPAPSSNFQ